MGGFSPMVPIFVQRLGNNRLRCPRKVPSLSAVWQLLPSQVTSTSTIMSSNSNRYRWISLNSFMTLRLVLPISKSEATVSNTMGVNRINRVLLSVSSLQHSFRSSSTKTTMVSNRSSSVVIENPPAQHHEGERCYQEAIATFANHEKHLEDEENHKAQQQYDAMQQAFIRQNEKQQATDGAVQVNQHRANRAAGVAVVKAISKQTRSEAKSNKEGKNNIMDDAEDWLLKGKNLLRKAALECKHKEALVRLGNIILEEANQQQQQQQQQQHGENYNQCTFSTCLPTYNGNSVVENTNTPMSFIEEAMLYYEMAGYYGSSEGWYNLGHVLWDGHYPTLHPDETNAMYAMHRATELGDADAMFFVGVHQINCDTNVELRQKGLEFIEQSAVKGHSGALYWLALLYLNGNDNLGISANNVEKFQYHLDRAALEQDNPDALFLRSHCMYYGEDRYEQNFHEALEGYLKAAHLGHAEAAINAGTMYYHGGVVERDLRRAFELYQIGAELGSIQGWRNLAWCYLFGEGVPKCENTANYITKTMLKDDDDNSASGIS